MKSAADDDLSAYKFVNVFPAIISLWATKLYIDSAASCVIYDRVILMNELFCITRVVLKVFIITMTAS